MLREGVSRRVNIPSLKPFCCDHLVGNDCQKELPSLKIRGLLADRSVFGELSADRTRKGKRVTRPTLPCPRLKGARGSNMLALEKSTVMTSRCAVDTGAEDVRAKPSLCEGEEAARFNAACSGPDNSRVGGPEARRRLRSSVGSEVVRKMDPGRRREELEAVFATREPGCSGSCAGSGPVELPWLRATKPRARSGSVGGGCASARPRPRTPERYMHVGVSV